MVRNFLFHRVSPQRDKLWDPMDVALFDKCISYISSKYDVMLLEDMVELPDLKSRKNIATIVFDDGYKDNIEYAAPILARYSCKASFYVVTDCIEKNIPTWTHILEHSFQYTKKSNINLTFDFLPAELRVTNLRSEEERMQYLRKLNPFLKTISHVNRSLVINRVKDTFNDVDLPRIMMDWRDLVELNRAGHYIGSHTVSHSMLGTMVDQDGIKEELLLSAQMIEKYLGYFPETISYPVGSYNQTVIRLSQAVGYSVGLAVGQRQYDPGKDSIFEIPRIELYNESWFKTRLRILDIIEPLKSIIGYKDNADIQKSLAGRIPTSSNTEFANSPQPDMRTPIFFSIVIPTYNRAHLISSTLESILAQTYSNYEVIIVDDGSTDNTEETVRKYLSDKVHYYKKANAERAAARNFGTHLAKGDYINWFDSDDVMFPNHLQEALNLILKYDSPEVFAQGHQYQDISGNVLQAFAYPSDIRAEMHKGNPVANSPVMVRRDIALANLFNEDRGLSGSEDYELWLRLASRYYIYASSKITVAVVFHNERSVVTMTDPDQLITRYTKFIQYTTSDSAVVALLGDHKKDFEMKNYLLLAVDLANNNHPGQGKKYLQKAFSCSPGLLAERGFYAFLKHYIRHYIS
jgi:glycosyltransferase involved in cell wall biosynthesis/peptidoglycan/xylan/chitin deacetylase (PgdA/CDA1 family)